MPQLQSKPNWSKAALELLQGCQGLEELRARIDLIVTIAQSLGDQLYPAFIQLLCVVNTHDDINAKRLLTQALVQALRTGRLPTGRLSAWGIEQLGNHHAFGQTRSLGPVEYLCAWYAQPSGREPLTELSLRRGLGDLMALINIDPDARNLYCAKLASDLEDPLGGALARSTQSALTSLVLAWRSGQSTERVISEFIAEVTRAGSLRLSGLSANLFTGAG